MSTLSSFFQLAQNSSDESKFFFERIQDQKSSITCYVQLTYVFAEALKLNSYRYRNAQLPPSPILDAGLLDALLSYLSSDIKDPLEQVMFEQITIIPGPGNNCVLYQTYTDTTKASLQNSVDVVRGIEYAIKYNELRKQYLGAPWAQSIPPEITNPNPSNVPSISDVKNTINTFSSWLIDNDPRLVYLNQLLSKGPKNIIDQIFDDQQQPINTFQFSEAFLSKIRISGQRKLENGKKAGNAFLETVQKMLSIQSSIWQQNTALQPIANQIKDNTRVNDKNLLLFAQTRELFKLGLSNSTIQNQVKAAIVNIFDEFLKRGEKSQQFLKDTLLSTCRILTTSVNPDPETLAEWASEVDEEITEYSSEENIKDLIDAASSVISSISLVPTDTVISSLITEARLFPFSNLFILQQQNEFIDYPRGESPLNTDTIVINQDAQENNGQELQPYFRPTLSVIADENDNAALKFFNVGGSISKDGIFYFLDTGNPNRVLSNELISKANLSFDFKNATINDSAVVPPVWNGRFSFAPVGTHYKYVNQSGASLKVFYQVIRAISKWSDLNARRTYDVLYQTSTTDIPFIPHLIWRLPAGRGLSRADQVDDSLILWEYKEPFKNYPRVGEFLCLPLSRRLTRRQQPYATLGNTTYQVVQEYERNINGFHYQFLELRSGPYSEVESYVLTNTPHPNLPSAIDQALNRTHASPIKDEALATLNLMNISYYRRVATSSSPNPKVIKWIPNNGNPHRPIVGDGITIDTTSDYTVIGIDLPISFRLLNNILRFKQLTSGNQPFEPALKNKENNLYRSQGARIDASSVMKNLVNYINPQKNPPSSRNGLSASKFGNWIISVSQSVINAWQNLKDTNSNVLPTDQEWCHIQGHGDGGTERLGNFVSGSFHCNTEQLAIESGQRITTQSLPRGRFKLYSTAYLMKNETDFLVANYLQNEQAYQQAEAIHKQLKQKQGKAFPKDRGAGWNLPFAAFFRYKIEEAQNDDRIKYFDHIFEGQSEFIDVHQYNILNKTVEFVLAGQDAFKEWYINQQDAFDEGNAGQ